MASTAIVSETRKTHEVFSRMSFYGDDCRQNVSCVVIINFSMANAVEWVECDLDKIVWFTHACLARVWIYDSRMGNSSDRVQRLLPELLRGFRMTAVVLFSNDELTSVPRLHLSSRSRWLTFFAANS